MRERALEWVKAKWTQEPHACPICANENWTVGDLGATPRLTEAGLLDQATVFPVIPVACDNCGYTMFFNARIAEGVLPPGIYKESSESSDEEGAPQGEASGESS